MDDKKNIFIRWWPALAAFAVYSLHCYLFRSWIMDDAGISFAYARNLASGHGLTAQPGVPPVEGYSNFAWIVIVAACHLFDIFDPLITSKILSMLFVGFTFILVNKFNRDFANTSGPVSFAILLLLASNSSFAIWTASGLENPLYIFLIYSLFMVSFAVFNSGDISRRNIYAAGLLAAGIALTRPDGVLYFFCFPLLALLSRPSGFELPGKGERIKLFTYASVFGVVYGGYILFRIIYFHDIFPNTYHAKGGPGLPDLIKIITLHPKMIEKLSTLATGFGGRYGNLILVACIVLTVKMVQAKTFEKRHGALATFLLLSFMIYMLLPTDWMPEFRFATPFLVFFYSYLVIVFSDWLAGCGLSVSNKKLAITLTGAVFLAGSVYMFSERSVEFSKNPIAPFDSVAKDYAFKFNDYARRLEVKDGSLLAADAGGTLYYSELRFYDLGRLTDKTIARTLNRDQAAFYNYIFEEAKPTFISTTGSWARKANLEGDPRFRRDYLPILEQKDPWINQYLSKQIYTGDFVRKDAVENKMDVLRQIQKEAELESKG